MPTTYVARMLSSGISKTIWTEQSHPPRWPSDLLTTLCMNGVATEPGLYIVATPDIDILNARVFQVERTDSGWRIIPYNPKPIDATRTDVAHWPPRKS